MRDAETFVTCGRAVAGACRLRFDQGSSDHDNNVSDGTDDDTRADHDTCGNHHICGHHDHHDGHHGDLRLHHGDPHLHHGVSVETPTRVGRESNRGPRPQRHARDRSRHGLRHHQRCVRVRLQSSEMGCQSAMRRRCESRWIVTVIAVDLIKPTGLCQRSHDPVQAERLIRRTVTCASGRRNNETH